MCALSRRLLALESRPPPSSHGCVLTYGLHETPDHALQRAPGPGGYVLLPDVLPPDVWDRLAREQQAAMVVGTNA